MYLFKVKNLLSADDCKALISLFERMNSSKDKHNEIGIDSFETKNSGELVNLSSQIDIIADQYSKIHKAMVDINETLRYELANYEKLELSIVKYTNGKVIPTHMDTNGRCTRKVAFVVALTEPSEYGGGEFYLDMGLGKTVRKLNQGDATVIPAFYPHGVNEVTSGVRYSLVVLYHGENAFS